MIRFKKDDGSNYPDWEEKTFGQIFDMFQTNTFSRDLLNYENGDTFNVHYGDVLVKFGSVIDCEKEELPFINEDVELLKYKDESYIQEGDIIVADTAEDYTAGKVSEVININDKKILSGLHTMLCRSNMKFAPKFLGYYMNSEQYHKQIVRLLVGTKVYSINKKVITDTILKYPCLEEQQKIANFLSSVDDIIAASEKEVAALEEQKKGAMQKIFSQEVRFKDDNGNDYPEWEEKTLESIGEFYGGLSGKTKDDFGKGVDYYVTYMNIYKNTFAKNDILDTVIIEENEKQNRVKYGDVLFTQSSETVEEVGLSSVYLFEDEPALNSFCFGFRPNNLYETLPKYMGYLFRTEAVRKQIMREGQGISRINLSPNRIRQIKLLFPCFEEQQKIADFLSDMDTAIDLAKQELEQWKELKKGLLQQLFE